MSKLLSDQTASELPAIFEAVRNMSQSTRGRPIRRDRGGQGGGSTILDFVISESKEEAEEYSGSAYDDFFGGESEGQEGILLVEGGTGTPMPTGIVLSVRQFGSRDIEPPPVQPTPPAEQLPTTESIYRPINNWLLF